MRCRSRNGKTVTSLAYYHEILREAHASIAVLHQLEEEAQMWQPKERRRRKERPENEQEAEVDDAEKVAEQKAAGDAEIESSKSPTKSAKQSDFY